MVDEIAREVGLMEQRVMADVDEDPQKFLSELFESRGDHREPVDCAFTVGALPRERIMLLVVREMTSAT
jgi:hypothetical protein